MPIIVMSIEEQQYVLFMLVKHLWISFRLTSDTEVRVNLEPNVEKKDKD